MSTNMDAAASVSSGGTTSPTPVAMATGKTTVSAAAAFGGTECAVTPQSLRIVRVLCPLLLRPAVLARRPFKPANSTVLPTVNTTTEGDPTIIPTEELVTRLKTLGKLLMVAVSSLYSLLSSFILSAHFLRSVSFLFYAGLDCSFFSKLKDQLLQSRFEIEF